MELSFIPTKLSLYRGDDNPIFGESVTTIELDDDAGGIFFKIQQDENQFGPGGELRFDFDEVQKLFEAISYLKKYVDEIKE